jgi:hypothetical protein
MPHITVPDQIPLNEFVVTGADATFDINFTFFDKSDLRITVDNVELAQDAFEIVGTPGLEGGYPGGTVTLDVAVSSCTVLIWSEIPPVRVTDFTEGGGLPTRAANTEFDRLTARARDLRLRAQRTPVLTFNAPTVIALEDCGQLFTNLGTVAGYTLPPASAGLTIEFAIVRAATLTIGADGTDTIRDVSSSGTAISASAIGSILRLICLTGESWSVASKNGTWAVA